MKNPFIAHPKEAGETYFEHLKFAANSAIKLIFSGIALLVHSVFPFLFITTASKTVVALNKEIEERKKTAASKNHPAI